MIEKGKKKGDFFVREEIELPPTSSDPPSFFLALPERKTWRKKKLSGKILVKFETVNNYFMHQGVVCRRVHKFNFEVMVQVGLA